jgi:hypothetical protein
MSLGLLTSLEVSMPRKRPVKKGSFGGHFDELVKHFPEEKPVAPGSRASKPKPHAGDIHDRLLESAWRHAHGARPPSH